MFRTIVKYTVFGIGVLFSFLLVGLLLYLTFENAQRGTAIYGTRGSDAIHVTGPFSILVNLGIVGLVASFLAYILYVHTRKEVFAKVYFFAPFGSVLLVLIGFVLAGA